MIQPHPRGESGTARTVLAALTMGASLAAKAGLQLVLMPLYAAYLGRADFGLWMLLQSIANTLTMADLGIGQSVMNFSGEAFARGDESRVNRVLSSAYALSVAVCFGLICLAWMLPFSGEAAGLGLVLGTLTLARVPFSVFNGALGGLRELPARHAIDVLQSAVILLSAIGVLRLGFGVPGLAAAVGGGMLLAAAASWPLLRLRRPFVRVELALADRATSLRVLSNSLHFLPLTAALMVQREGLNLLGALFCSIALLPPLALMLAVFRLLLPVPIAICAQAIQPYVIRYGALGDRESLRLLLEIATKSSLAAAFALAAGILCAAETAISLWVGPGMFPGHGLAAAFAAAFLADSLLAAPLHFAVALNAQRWLSWPMLKQAAASVAAGALAGFFTGGDIWAIAFAFLAAATASSLGFVRSEYEVTLALPPRSLLFTGARALGPLLLFAGLPAAIARLALGQLAAAALVAPLAALCWWHRVLDSRERSWLLERWRALRSIL